MSGHYLVFLANSEYPQFECDEPEGAECRANTDGGCQVAARLILAEILLMHESG